MDTRLKVRNTVLVGALAAITATAWATNEGIYEDSTYVPLTTTVIVEPPAVPVTEGMAVNESLTPTETVVLLPPAPAPVAEPLVAQSGIIVEDRKPSEDERIQMAVMDKLAASPNISGKIGVESRDAVVTLTGYTTTAGQAYRAGRYAGSVTGVKYVQNEIRPRIGGSV